jgi:ribose-phosphate pyrophosphokinase
VKVFSGSSNKSLAEKIAKGLKKELSPVEIFTFPDGERRIRVEEKVLDDNCILIQSTGPPTDTNYMELFLLIDALKRSGAKKVEVLIPYLGYQRQDHIFRSGEAVSLEVIAETLERVGMDELFSFDLHTPKAVENFIVSTHHLSALPTFAKKIKTDLELEEVVLVSPDMGGIRRIKIISELLNNTPYATIIKNRDLYSGTIEDSALEGEVRGKTAVIVDDMISTGKTVVSAVDLLLENGAKKVFTFATHPVFSEKTPELLQNSRVEKIFVTDTIEVERSFPKLEILSIAQEAIKALKS